jgi:hypothetical protein
VLYLGLEIKFFFLDQSPKKLFCFLDQNVTSPPDPRQRINYGTQILLLPRCLTRVGNWLHTELYMDQAPTAAC